MPLPEAKKAKTVVWEGILKVMEVTLGPVT